MAEHPTVQLGDIWYRYEGARVGHWDYEFEYSTGHHVELQCRKYHVSKVTPKGVWLGFFPEGKDRFVLLNARKMWAHPTQDAALKAFLARKKRQVSILESQLKDVRAAMVLAEKQLAQLGRPAT